MDKWSIIWSSPIIIYHIMIQTFWLENRELEGACSWHQTTNCAWDGPREEDNDLGCDVDVPATVSGYCLCEDGRKEMKKGCVAGEYATCSEACIGKV